MQSPFGVEHGETFAKFGMPKVPALKPLAVGVKSLGAGIGAKVQGMSKPMGHMANKNMATGVGKPKSLLGNVQMKMGQGVKAAGAGMQAHPGATGGAAIGTGVLGSTGAGYGLGHHFDQPKKPQ